MKGRDAVLVPLQSAASEQAAHANRGSQAVIVCLGALSTLNPIQENAPHRNLVGDSDPKKNIHGTRLLTNW